MTKKGLKLESLNVQSFTTTDMRAVNGGGTDETRCPPCTDASFPDPCGTDTDTTGGGQTKGVYECFGAGAGAEVVA